MIEKLCLECHKPIKKLTVYTHKHHCVCSSKNLEVTKNKQVVIHLVNDE